MIFALTMQAVSNMHSRRILHNDFNDGNLLFDDGLSPVCIDFGRGRPFEVVGDNKLELLCFASTGTTYYASHESLRSKTQRGNFQGFTSTKGDVYAVTAVLYHIIFCMDPVRPLDFDKTPPPIPWERKLTDICDALDRYDPMRLTLGAYRQCLQFNPLMRPSAATAIRNARQFASIFMTSEARDALDRVLDGTLKHYPWDLLSQPSV